MIYRLVPVFKDYIWGGNKLSKYYGKNTDIYPLAESWELSFNKDGLTKTTERKALTEVITEEEKGENCKRFPFFPVLIKFIDAKDNLSFQVHPSDEYALKNENSFGKTEMWYIVDAEEGAGIYLGFKRDVKKEEVISAIKNNTITDMLNFYKVKKGQSFFIPAGTIHAIGKGCLIYEVQQNSNLTYRVYDYNRKDSNGNTRELHIEKALKVLDLHKFTPIKFDGVLSKCEYFCVEKFAVHGETAFTTDYTSFKCITCLSGEGYLNNEKMNQGDSFFVSTNQTVKITGNCNIIVTQVK